MHYSHSQYVGDFTDWKFVVFVTVRKKVQSGEAIEERSTLLQKSLQYSKIDGFL